jgi:hypothetical protein
MLYVVYLKPNTIDGGPCLVGVFLMKSDAEIFIKNSTLKEELVLVEVDNVWGNWTAIREEMEKEK